jgi:zinc protease
VSVGLAPIRTTLDNGVTCLAKSTAMTPAVSISLAIRAGSSADRPGEEGTAWLLSRVIDRGTATRSAADIAEELDSRGITLTVNVTRHLFSLVCTCLSEDFEPVLALLGEMLIAPSLPDAELATRKGEVITALRQDEENPRVRATEALMALLYPDGHPYGRRTKGSIEIVEGLTRDRLQGLHAARFAPSELTAIVVGDVEASRAAAIVARVFDGWRRPAPAPIPLASPTAATTRRRLVIPMMNKSQADIAYGFTTLTRRDPAYDALWLMNNAFGQYAIGGRLGDRIRERQGIAYDVSSSLDADVIEGPLAIRVGVGPADVDRAIASIDEEVARLVRDGLTPKELDESRRYLAGSLPRALETNAAIANFLQIEEFFGLGLDYDARLPERLGAVTLEDVQAAAGRAMSPERAAVAIAGPYQE